MCSYHINTDDEVDVPAEAIRIIDPQELQGQSTLGHHPVMGPTLVRLLTRRRGIMDRVASRNTSPEHHCSRC